jgi:ElaB/YqjD/DUF883 family membrane-anchored ribosome-binding protein
MLLTKSDENSGTLPAQRTNTLTHHGTDSLRETSHQLRVKAEQVSENTVHRIQHNPVKAMLIAAATGAGLMALVHLVSRPHDRR